MGVQSLRDNLPMLGAVAAMGRVAALRTCLSTYRLPARTGPLVPLYPLFRIPRRKKSVSQIFQQGYPKEPPPLNKN